MMVVNCLCSDGRTRQYKKYDAPDIGYPVDGANGKRVRVTHRSQPFWIPDSDEEWLKFCKVGLGGNHATD